MLPLAPPAWVEAEAGVGRPQPGAAWVVVEAQQLRVWAEAQRPQVSMAAEAPTASVAEVAAG